VFHAQAPNQLWCGDITYLRTRCGFVYLAVLLDLFSRAVVGFALGPQLDRTLVLQALRRALRRRRLSPGLVHHTDRGSQYASDDYQRELKQHGLVCSMSRAGDCYDNAPSESFFSTLKAECPTEDLLPEQVPAVIEQYICGFYNPVRKHSSLGYVSPMEFERRALAMQHQAPSST
jgi:transposase InsO family protein